MGEHVTLKSAEFVSFRVSDRTEWTFALVTDEASACALVEVTCGQATPEACRLLANGVSSLEGRPISDEASMADMLGLTLAQLRSSRALATAVSALRTAVVDIRAQRAGLGLTEALGGSPQPNVPLYANINRCLFHTDRSPRAFAEAALTAVRQGFSTIKCAPFDEVRPSAGADILELARPGLQRVAAVRSAIGRDARLLVDCHSRFTADTACAVGEELARLGVGWFEEPLEPTRDAAALAQVATRVSIPLAGGESGYGEAFFVGLARQGAVRTIMPDIKHCGGVAEACRAGRSASAVGASVSLHSPSGPVSQLASAHVTAATPGALPLEHAINEAHWRAELLEPGERIERGRLLLPGGAGLGARLSAEAVRRRGVRWKP